MGYNTEELNKEVPLTWFLAREGDIDIYACKNTGEVADETLGIAYVQRAEDYREHAGIREKERFVIVTDDLNSARKTAFLLAGDVKNDYMPMEEAIEKGIVSEDSAKSSEFYSVKSEDQGVYMAQVNLHDYSDDRSYFPDLSYELDGAIFYGAKGPKELTDSLGMILTCNLAYIAVIVDKELWDTDVVRSLLFDYWFDEYDCRGLELSDGDVKSLVDLIDCDGCEDFAEKTLFLKNIRGKDFKEEDIIRLLELLESESIQTKLVPDITPGNEEPLLTTKLINK